MKNSWLIDTDILIDYLRGYTKAVKFIDTSIAELTCYISIITVAELYAGVRDGNERHILEQFLQVFEIVSLNEETAQTGGLYRRDYRKSHGVGLPDALIAATAKYVGATLVTLNKKHYPMLTKVHVPYLKST